MELSAWKLKLSVLWCFQLFNFIAVLLIPASVDEVKAQLGNMLGGLIVFYFVLTCLMMWLTLAVKPSVIRWGIMLIGVFYAYVKVQWLIQCLTKGFAMEFTINELWGLVAALMLVWHGWKAPKAVAA
ncbi:MAG TPA: hypothetical protein VMH83_14895 [Candidatus Acidoferrum sp.]|nr:hypothetical protein [Candidatus Acidoferrum sp.]